MTHYRYTKKKGKIYGPYVYENKRVNGKVVSKYVGKSDESKGIFQGFSFNIFLAVILLAVVLLALFVSNDGITGNVILDSDSVNQNYYVGENLTGHFSFSIQKNLINSAVLNVALGDQEKEINVNELINSNSSLIYPDVDFNLLLVPVISSDLNETPEIISNGSTTLIPEVPEVSENNSVSSPGEVVSEPIVSEPISEPVVEQPTQPTQPTEPEQPTPAPEQPTQTEQPIQSEPVQDTQGQAEVAEQQAAPEQAAQESPQPSESPADASGGITGNAILGEENSGNIISGSARKGNDFSYDLNGQSASIEEGSVKYAGTAIGDDKVNLNINDGKAVVSTDYSVESQSDEITIDIDLSRFNLSAENGVLRALLITGNESENVLEKEILVSNLSSVLNETNETVMNLTIVNVTGLAFIGNIPSIRVQMGESYDLDLKGYFENAESYGFMAENISGQIVGSVLTITPNEGFKGSRKGKVIAYAGNESVESNQFNILVGGIKVDVNHGNITLGEPVKWTADVSLEGNDSAIVNLPKEAENITVNSADSNAEGSGGVFAGISGNVISDSNSKGIFSMLISWFSGKGITGNVVSEDENVSIGENVSEIVVQTENLSENMVQSAVQEIDLTAENESVSVVLNNSQNYTIEYYTDAPVAVESDTNYGKKVQISGPDLNYTDVLSFANVSEMVDVGNEDKIQIYWEENQSYIPFDAYDLNDNGKIDYVEWITPHLSKQTFDIILVAKAEHLDSNRKVIEDVYNSVRTLDSVSAEIPKGDYIRVMFEAPLDSTRDISLYASGILNDTNRSVGVKVYEKNKNNLIADFGDITSFGKYKIYTTNLTKNQDTFDLLVYGSENSSVSFDYIVDPTNTAPNQPGLVSPVNRSSGVLSPYTLSVSVSDPESDSMNVTFWDKTSKVSVGDYHTCGIIANGSAMCWGGYSAGATYGSLGDGFNAQSLNPVYVNTTNTFRSITAGGDFSCGIIANGSLMCWGENALGQIGDGFASSSYRRYNPVFTNTSNTFVAISAGWKFACGIIANGSVMCWGNNDQGEFGNGGTTSSANPVYSTVYSSPYVAISSGGQQVCGILANGTAMCWGAGASGRLGNGGTAQQNTPVAVNTANKFIAISSGWAHGCGIISNGSAMCWGAGTNGRLGYGGTSEQDSPVYVNTTNTFTHIATGVTQSCGITSNGSAMCWGSATIGRLGNGATTPDQPNPVYVNIASTFIDISCNSLDDYGCCGILTNGTAVCWGSNAYGQIGDGTKTQQTSPYPTNTVNTFASRIIGTSTNVASGGSASLAWSGLNYLTTYIWNVMVSDGGLIANSPIWSFTSQAPPPGAVYAGSTETNNAVYARSNIEVNVTMTDTAPGNITIRLHNSTGLMYTNVSANGALNYLVNYTSLTQGVYTFNATAINTGGIMNNTATRTVSIDNSGPAITVTSPINGKMYNTSSISISFSSTDSMSSIDKKWFYNGTGNTTYTTPVSQTAAEGSNTFILYSNDSLGNLNSTSVTFTVDTIYPRVNIAYPTNTSYNSIQTALNYSYSDTNTGSCWYSLDSGVTNSTVQTCGTNWTGLTSTQGSNSWRVYGNDTAGNLNSSTILFFVDSLNPGFSFTDPSETNNALYTRSNIQVNATMVDSYPGNITIRLYNSTGLINTSVSANSLLSYFVNYTSLAQGVYTFNATAVDTSNNQNNSETRTVTIDLTPPTLTITSPANQSYATNNISINFTSSDALSSIDKKWFYNGTGNTTYTTAVYQIVGQGGNTFLFYSNDTAGNLNTTIVNFFVDSLIPNVAVTYPTNSTYNSVVTALNYSYSDTNTGSCWYSLDSGVTNSTAQTCGTNWTGLTSTQGSNSWRVYGNDTTGNLNSSTISFTVDSISPTVDLVSPTPLTATSQAGNSIYANLSTSDTNQHYSLVDFDNSLVGWWRFEGNANDETGINNGTPNGAVSLAEGKFGNGLYMNGSANQYVQVPFGYDVSNGSFGVWVKSTEWSGGRVEFVSGAMELFYDNGRLYSYPPSGSSYGSSIPYSYSSYIGSWKHYAITWNLSNYYVYLDAQLVMSGANYNAATGSMLQIGNGYFNFQGIADDALLFSRTLSAAEISSWYNAQVTQYENNFTSLASGNHTLKGYAVDIAGNKNSTATRTILVDLTPPTLTITSPANQSYATNNISINFTSADVLSSIDKKWFYNGTGNTTYTTAVYQTVGQGGNTFLFYSNDSVGNLNTTAVSFFVDSLAPTLTITSPANVSYNTTSITISFTSADVLSSIDKKWFYNGTGNTTYTTAVVQTVGQGSRMFLLYSNDSLGNLNSTAVNFFVDSIIPEVYFTNPVETTGSYVNRNNLQVNSTMVDTNPANITIRLYNLTGLMNTSVSTAAARSYFVNYTGLTDGNYTFNSTVVDTLNNQNNSETRRVVVDTIAPRIDYGLLTDANDSNLFRSNVVVNVTVSDVNSVNLTIRLFGPSGFLQEVNSSSSILANFTGLDDDPYYYNATVTDMAGNVNYSETRRVNVLLDYVNPSLYFVTGSDNNRYKSVNNIFVNLSVSDKHLANLTVRLFNVSSLLNETIVLVNGSYAFNYTPLVDGLYYVNATAIDLSSNRNESETRNITLDTVNPSIIYGSGLEADGTNVSRSWIFGNLSIVEINEANTSFNLYNSTRGLVNSSVLLGQRMINWTGISNGVYYYNATVTDLAGRMNSTGTRRIVLDTIAPTISYINSTTVIQNLSTNLTLITSDALSGLSTIVFELSYPNGTFTNYTPSYLGGVYNLSLNLSDIGDYIMSAYVNDSAGNVANSSTSFESYVPLTIVGSVTDSYGASRNYGFAFYSPGTDTLKYNFTGSSYSSSDLHLRNYDLLITTDNSQKLLLYNLTMNQTIIPVQVDNFTSSTMSDVVLNHKVLVGLGVNSTFHGDGLLNLSYAGLFDPEFSAISESGLEVYKCANYSYSTRRCIGDYALYPNYTIDTSNDRVIVNISGFSAYALSERTCGNSICQASYGETLTSCPEDCNDVPSGSSSGSSSGGGSSGGGGGGGSSGAGANSSVALQFNMLKIERQVPIGDSVTENLDIDNALTSDMVVQIEVSPSLQSLILVNSTTIVKARSSTSIPILIIGTSPGVYTGEIDLKTNVKNYSIPVTILVTGKSDRLLDLSVVLAEKSVTAGDDLDFTISAFNLGKLQRYDIFVDYMVQARDSNSTIVSNSESFAIETSLSLARKLNIPASAKNGDYALVVRANYGDDQTAIASANFRVGREGLTGNGTLSNYLSMISAAALLIVLVGGSIYYFVTIRRKLFEKKMEEIKKNSIYVFPDFKLLPQSKFAYIGLVADTDVKTYLDYTQLNRHTLIAGGTGSGKTVAGMVVVEELIKRGTNVIVLDPVGQWTGFANKNNDKIMSNKYKKFGISSPKAFPVSILEINKDNMNLDIHAYMNRKGLVVLKMSKLSPKDIDLFVEQCLKRIYTADLAETSSLKSVIVLDEVHRILPKYGGKKAYVRLEQAVREFRKWGVGLLMISQVLTDFKGAIRGNIGTEIQLQTRYEGDIKRVRERSGSKISRLVSKMPVGLGIVECPSYNHGAPYFVEFRPLLHSPFKLTDAEIAKYTKKEKPILLSNADMNVKATEKKEEEKAEEGKKEEKKTEHHSAHNPAHHAGHSSAHKNRK